MTEQEARTVAEIAISADGFCHVCGGNLIKQLIEEFPEHEKALTEEYTKYHESELND